MKAMDIFSDIIQTITSFMSPVQYMPASTVFIVLVSVGLSLISIWATNRFTDVEEMKENTKEVQEWQKKFKKARETMDPVLMQEVQDSQSRIMTLQSKMMSARCKPMLIFYIPLILVFTILNSLYAGVPVAVLPFNPQEALWFIDPWLGVNIPGNGFGLHFYTWYLLSSVGLGNMIRKAFGQDLASTTPGLG